jgi:protein O-GlcNAc transferase
MSTTESSLAIAALVKEGASHHQAGRLREAEWLYRQALELDPGHVEALVLLGMAAGQSGQLSKAAEFFTRALERDPDNAQIHHNLGETWRHLGQFQKAQASLRRAIALDPDHMPAYQSAADLMQEEAKRREAAGKLADAGELRRIAARYFLNAGNSQLRKKHNAIAAGFYEAALKLDPDNANILSVLAHAQQTTPSEAVKSLERALALDPKLDWIYGQLGNALLPLGRSDEAVAAYEKGLALNPKSRTCRQGLASVRLTLPIYDGSADAAKIYDLHHAWGEEIIESQGKTTSSFAKARDPEKRLKVGYVSPDLKRHSVSYFLEPLLVRHDPAAVEVFCYSGVEGRDADETTARLKGLVPHWHDAAELGDEEFGRQVHADGIDILIDLTGHTARNRLIAFAAKPAPVTATWLGYPATTGLPNMDWRITDAVVDPPGAEAFHTERLMRLEGPFLCYRPPADAPEVAPPPAITKEPITFGSFNNHLKLNPSTIAAWSRILQALPESKLVLKSTMTADSEIQRRVLDRFTQAGIDRERVAMNQQHIEVADHLAAYGEIDIALDPFPYNGTTTTCEALWMGVPVIALIGDRHSGRVGFDLLTRIGLERFAAPDVDSYVRLAAQVAKDLPGIAELRRSLRTRLRASPLCDENHFAREFEAALRQMWRQWCASAA